MASERRSIYIPAHLIEPLDLAGDGLSQRLAAVCDRYLHLTRPCPPLTRAEWMVLLDAGNGWASWAEAGETLMLGLAAEVADYTTLQGPEPHGLTRQQGHDLAHRLAAMTPTEILAIVERIERFWRRHDLATPEAMRAAGIVPTDGDGDATDAAAT